MARTRNENGVEIPLTPEEETARDAEEKAWADKQVELKKTQYQRDRLQEYPSIEECVHAILDGELDALQAKRKIVKERHPKGGN